ncbi:hypothetical protein ACUIZJ_001710 [Enterobacter kobei]
MMKHETIEAVLKEMARQQGHELNGNDMLKVRTHIATALAAKERHRQRMNAKPYLWRKSKPQR